MVDKDENSKNTENRKSTSRSAAGRKTAPKSAATAVSALGESEAGKTGLIPDDATGESTTDRPKRRRSNARSEAGSGPAKAKKNTDSKPEEASRADKPAGLAPLFQAPDLPKRKAPAAGDGSGSEESNSSLRHRTRRRSGEVGDLDSSKPNTVVKVRQPRKEAAPATEPQKVKGSTRLEAKKQRRRDGRDAGRKRTVITEAEFLARRESVDRVMVVRGTA
ncbi:MAG: ribonuclease E/G, partial [Microbacteriaceae bacterium]|nr:ribonuclease E/G [Microbacteriaceae bacterium]